MVIGMSSGEPKTALDDMCENILCELRFLLTPEDRAVELARRLIVSHQDLILLLTKRGTLHALFVRRHGAL